MDLDNIAKRGKNIFRGHNIVMIKYSSSNPFVKKISQFLGGINPSMMHNDLLMKHYNNTVTPIETLQVVTG